MLVLALTFSDRIAGRPRPTHAMILLASPPLHRTVPQARRPDTIPPRLFRAPAIQSLPAPLLEPVPAPALQIPLIEVTRPLLAKPEIARLPVVAPPPLRIDNLTSLLEAPAKAADSAAIVVARSSGFEQLTSEAPRRSRGQLVLHGGFDDATLLPASQPQRAAVAPALAISRSVEIISKPRPVYTEEARQQQIEGEVLLEVLFASFGQVRVLRTVRGLGHGLDENAIAAAETIRFRPAERAGIPADSTAIVHIVFQLAF